MSRIIIVQNQVVVAVTTIYPSPVASLHRRHTAESFVWVRGGEQVHGERHLCDDDTYMPSEEVVYRYSQRWIADVSRRFNMQSVAASQLSTLADQEYSTTEMEKSLFEAGLEAPKLISALSQRHSQELIRNTAARAITALGRIQSETIA